MFSLLESAKFNTREQVSEKSHVRLGRGLYRKLVCVAVLGGTRVEDEDLGRSAPFFHLFPTMKKILTLIFLSIIAFNAIHAEITWTLSNDGTLTISGTDMPNYNTNNSYYNCPWYYKRSQIKKVVIENGVTSIGERAFEGCSSLTSITIPNSVTSIGNSVFQGCTNLTSVTIPNSVTSLGRSVFSNCSSLTSVTLPNSVTSIGGDAFYYCKGLTSIDIPNSVTSIGVKAFYECSKLSSVKLPKFLTSIGERAFYNCNSLTSINIPNGVTSIGKQAFKYCM